MTPDQIARKLSPAQREAVRNARWIGQGVVQMCVAEFAGPWPAPIAHFLTLRQDALNDLGLQVRALLTEEDND